jgi:hypothetical protein
MHQKSQVIFYVKNKWIITVKNATERYSLQLSDAFKNVKINKGMGDIKCN